MKFKDNRIQHLHDQLVKWPAPTKKRNKRLTKKLYYIQDFNETYNGAKKNDQSK